MPRVTTRYVYMDETKRTGYVVAAVTVVEPAAVRKVVRGLLLPGQRRLHMVRERPVRKRQIVDAICQTEVVAVIYDAGRRYPSELAARRACLEAVVADFGRRDTWLTIERDEGMVRHDNRALNETARTLGFYDTLRYDHQEAGAEPLLALPDVLAWCWTKGGDWHRLARHYQPSGRLPGSLPAATALGRVDGTTGGDPRVVVSVIKR